MAAEISLHVQGLAELNRALRRVDAEHPKLMRKIHKEVAEPVAAEARRRIKSRSGRLASTVRPLAGQNKATIAVGYNRKALIYAPINHFGGYPGAYAGNPFLYDAARAMQTKTVDTYARLLDRFLDDVFAGIGP